MIKYNGIVSDEWKINTVVPDLKVTIESTDKEKTLRMLHADDAWSALWHVREGLSEIYDMVGPKSRIEKIIENLMEIINESRVDELWT